jgi:hypothetical protein
VAEQKAAASGMADETCVGKLAHLFPTASPVHLPVCIMAMAHGGDGLQERTVVEYGTAQEVLFSSKLPLEFEDQLRIKNSDGSLDTNVKVVAVRYQDGMKAVAARFLDRVENWIIKP